MSSWHLPDQQGAISRAIGAEFSSSSPAKYLHRQPPDSLIHCNSGISYSCLCRYLRLVNTQFQPIQISYWNLPSTPVQHVDTIHLTNPKSSTANVNANTFPTFWHDCASSLIPMPSFSSLFTLHSLAPLLSSPLAGRSRWSIRLTVHLTVSRILHPFIQPSHPTPTEANQASATCPATVLQPGDLMNARHSGAVSGMGRESGGDMIIGLFVHTSFQFGGV
ncbi:hypothetical protein DFJ58DRAFT_849897 [Suillus subalutaceus]|uniref:uncharacterized protein n=1 Tax=Suillus subalutaceus TaxID=48586 RepID=UPI001B85DC22|nr:uncharacterized protein DFJ58DRAFT_849897 [Suillus subalutaceus]KAG1822241.1 hypothetical protein DFJ58DRAFT_849897 [Suillus subalutaceus]